MSIIHANIHISKYLRDFTHPQQVSKELMMESAWNGGFRGGRYQGHIYEISEFLDKKMVKINVKPSGLLDKGISHMCVTTQLIAYSRDAGNTLH